MAFGSGREAETVTMSQYDALGSIGDLFDAAHRIPAARTASLKHSRAESEAKIEFYWFGLPNPT